MGFGEIRDRPRTVQDTDMPGKRPVHICALTILLLAGCTPDRGDIGFRNQCSTGLDAGYRELSQAEADGFGGAVTWTKAASLLGAAKIQQQFEEYQNCVIKVNKARQYVRELRG
jgi:hypothetical protein